MLEVHITKRKFWNNGEKESDMGVLRGNSFAYLRSGYADQYWIFWSDKSYVKFLSFFDRAVGETDGYFFVANRVSLESYLLQKQRATEMISSNCLRNHHYGEDPYHNGPIYDPEFNRCDFYLPDQKFDSRVIVRPRLTIPISLLEVYHDGRTLIKGSVSKLEKIGLHIQMKN